MLGGARAAPLLTRGSRIISTLVLGRIIEGDNELGWRVSVFRGYSESHQVLWDHLNAIVPALVDDCMAIIRGDQTIKQLVHHFDLHVCRFKHVSTVNNLELLVPLTLLSFDCVVLLEFLHDHVIGLLDLGRQRDGRLVQKFLACRLD